jgi:hypothetical protein
MYLIQKIILGFLLDVWLRRGYNVGMMKTPSAAETAGGATEIRRIARIQPENLILPRFAPTGRANHDVPALWIGTSQEVRKDPERQSA